MVVATFLAAHAGCSDNPAGIIGSCEQLYTLLHIQTADGRPTIAGLEIEGPCAYESGCWPRLPDAGTAGGCQDIRLRGTNPGTCHVTVVSTGGRRAALTFVLRLVPTTRRCKESNRVYENIPELKADLAFQEVDFGPTDALDTDGV